MDCNTARMLGEFLRPDASELDASEREALERHLAGCADCQAHVDGLQRVHAHMSAAVQAVPVPDFLHSDILRRLESATSERPRRPVTRRLQWLAAAAVVLICVYAGFQFQKPVVLDLEQISSQVFGETTNPSPETVAEWFRERKVDVIPPADFNYRLLMYYSFADLQGVSTPLLVFTSGKAQARVFILSDRQFNLRALAGGLAAGSGGNSVVRPFADGRSAYLIIYTGEALDPFLADSTSN